MSRYRGGRGARRLSWARALSGRAGVRPGGALRRLGAALASRMKGTLQSEVLTPLPTHKADIPFLRQQSISARGSPEKQLTGER